MRKVNKQNIKQEIKYKNQDGLGGESTREGEGQGTDVTLRVIVAVIESESAH